MFHVYIIKLTLLQTVLVSLQSEHLLVNAGVHVIKETFVHHLGKVVYIGMFHLH